MKHLALCVALALPAVAQAAPSDPRPTAWTERVQPLDAVERITMPPVDVETLKAEDDRHFAETGEKNLRYAAGLKVDLTPETVGTWERLDSGELLWRLRVYSKNARSLNFAFDQYLMPAGGRLFIYSADAKHVYRPFTADDNEDHGELWTPPVFGAETVLELTIPEVARGALKLHLALVNHDYRGFGQGNMEKSGSCNIDIVCPIGDPYNDQDRANAVISTGGGTICSGSLINNTANDARPYFMTAEHCGINAGNAASLVTFWNYFNSTCRPIGSPESGGPGDGQLNQFNTGSFFRAGWGDPGAANNTDFTLVELDDPLLPAFNLFLAGWDRTPMPAQFNATVAIHHPSTDEMRITFAPGTTADGAWPTNDPPDGSHIHAFWGTNLGVTEPGSSGSPLYTSAGRYIGQLHGGPSACGAGDLSDYYGRFSGSWTGGGTNDTRVSNWLDPSNTGQITLDGRNACTFPAAPTGTTATATAANTIQVTWTAVPGATTYNVLRAVGACPQTSYVQIATTAATTYDDTTVSGGTTYSYVVQSVVAGCPSLNSNCDDALATGACTLAPTFAGAASVTQPTPGACRLDVNWAAGTTNCAGTLTYNVYRSTDPVFVPAPANLRQSCVNALTFADTTVTTGNTYYYIVRAEDSTTTGTGPCNGGNTDTNLARRSGNPDQINQFFDDIESGAGLWTVDDPGPGNPFAIVTTQSNSPTHSWFVDDPTTVTDQRIAFTSPVTVPAGSPVLSFFHRYDLELGPPPYDGGVLEYSLDGSNWFDILAGTGSIPPNANRFLAHPYPTETISTCCMNPLQGRRAWSGAQNTFVETRVNMADFAGASVRLRWRRGTDSSVAGVGWWIDDVRISHQQACGTQAQAVEAMALAMDTAGNGILQPNETVAMEPAWRNIGSAPIALTGVASNFTGPTATYTIPDNTASYGTIAVAGNASCTASTNCYTVNVVATPRPLVHWDATIRETVTPTSTIKSWTLHVGDSFTDVVAANPFYRFVETILHKTVTGGCTATTYCPGNPTTREQMAVFVLLSKEPVGYVPPDCGATPQFADVPVSSPFCKWVEELFRRGVVAGCGAGLYCPSSPVTREQMSVFVLRTLDGTLDPPACAPPNMFADVPETSPFCRWIEELARRGVVTGCGGTPPNYCPTANVTRDQMSVFLSVTFGLVLYGL